MLPVLGLLVAIGALGACSGSASTSARTASAPTPDALTADVALLLTGYEQGEKTLVWRPGTEWEKRTTFVVSWVTPTQLQMKASEDHTSSVTVEQPQSCVFRISLRQDDQSYSYLFVPGNARTMEDIDPRYGSPAFFTVEGQSLQGSGLVWGDPEQFSERAPVLDRVKASCPNPISDPLAPQGSGQKATTVAAVSPVPGDLSPAIFDNYTAFLKSLLPDFAQCYDQRPGVEAVCGIQSQGTPVNRVTATYDNTTGIPSYAIRLTVHSQNAAGRDTIVAAYLGAAAKMGVEGERWDQCLEAGSTAGYRSLDFESEGLSIKCGGSSNAFAGQSMDVVVMKSNRF